MPANSFLSILSLSSFLLRLRLVKHFPVQVRVENVKNPDDYIAELLSRVKSEYIAKTYGVAGWTDHVDFLTQMATKSGKLLKVPLFFPTSSALFFFFSFTKTP